MNKVQRLLGLLVLVGCQHDKGVMRDSVRQPQPAAATASVHNHASHLVPPESSAQTDDPDTAQWQELTNKWGWKIKFPKTWEAFVASLDDRETVETSDGPTIYGPTNCSKPGARCRYADIHINSIPLRASRPSPKEYLMNEVSTMKPIGQGETEVSGFPAYEVFALQQNRPGFPQGQPVQLIAVKHPDDGRILLISYSEDTADGDDKSTMKSPSDWK